MKKYTLGAVIITLAIFFAVPLAARAVITAVGSYDTTNAVSHVQVVGSFAYILELSVGLKILDISNPASPTLAGTYALPNISWFTVVGNHAYVTGGGTLTVLDVTALTAIEVAAVATPTVLGSYTDAAFHAGRVVSDGTYAYVSGYIYDGSTQFQVRAINVSTPASPTWAKTLTVSGASDMTLVGSYL